MRKFKFSFEAMAVASLFISCYCQRGRLMNQNLTLSGKKRLSWKIGKKTWFVFCQFWTIFMDNFLLVPFTFTFSPRSQIFIRTCELVVFHDNTDTNPKCAAARAISLVLRRFYCLALLINVQLCKAGMNAGWVEIFRKSEYSKFEGLCVHICLFIHI